jgi:hypothetical protein
MGGLEMLLEVYCSRDDNFEPGKFKNVLSEFGIGPKEARIMHVRLDRWRKDAALLEHEKKERPFFLSNKSLSYFGPYRSYDYYLSRQHAGRSGTTRSGKPHRASRRA